MAALEALHAHLVIDFEGILLIKDGEAVDIKAGDLYLAERNTGPKLLTCESVSRIYNWVVPTTTDYSYDFTECVKVREATHEDVILSGFPVVEVKA